MKIADYYKHVLMPANMTISAMRRAGLPIDRERVVDTAVRWEQEILALEREVEGAAAEKGLHLKYSPAHAPKDDDIKAFLYGPQGLKLEVYKLTEGGAPSMDDEALLPYASVSHPREGDLRVVWAILKIRSLSKGRSTHFLKYLDCIRSDGAVHAKFNWTLKTARLSAEDPPLHQIPERSDKEVADAIKVCMIPRVKPAPHPEEWDPRKHGSCWRWDIEGAEAAIRAAMLTHRFCSKPDPAWEYLRLGKDIHGRTAALIYGKPEGTYKKGDWERDTVGKQSFFAKQFGGSWKALQGTFWTRAREWIEDAEAKRISAAFDAGYPGLTELYELIDKVNLAKLGYCEDGYGRRRWFGLPEGVRFGGVRDGRTQWHVAARSEEARKFAYRSLENKFHMFANTPTQSMSATDALWMMALCYLGEYVELRVPPMWEKTGVLFPEAKKWRLHEGPGPGGKPFLAWHSNYVHDSAWGHCAPGYLEPLAKLVFRRCTALPFDWRLEADVPYRIELKAGPDQAHLRDYNKIATEFGFEPMPKR